MDATLGTVSSRRRVLQSLGAIAGITAVASVMAACGGGTAAPAAAPTSAPAAAPTTAAQPTAAPAAAATTAPAAPTTAAAAPTAPAAAPTTAAAAPTAAPAAQAGGGKGSIELWMQHPEWKDAMAAVVKAFQQKYPDVNVNVTAQAQNYTDQVQTALNAGIGPDVFQAPTRPQLDIQIKTGQLMDLSHKVDQTAWTEVAKQAVTVAGKVWGVPGGKYTVGIAYHMNLFDKAGIKDEPRTWAEMTEAFNKLKAINVIPYSIAA